MFKKILENLSMAKAKKTTKKSKVKVAKKTSKKAAKKTTKKTAKKAAKKTTKKVAKKATKKVAKKATKKVAKKATKKVAKKATKKVAKKATKKVARKATKKVTKKAAEKVVKKAIKKVSRVAAEKVTKKVTKKVEKKTITKVVKKATSAKKFQEEVVLDKDIEKKIKSASSQKLKEAVAEEVLQLSEDYRLNDIFESIRDISYFQNYSDECIERNCDSPSSSKGYCRLHYIANWKDVKKRESILIDGKLQDFIEDLAKKYSLKNIELMLSDLSDEKSFFATLNEMDIESVDDEQGAISGDGSDEDDQDIAFETKSTKSGYFEE
jgi:hypothetical protein